jgi:hypothetical protein
MQVIIADFYNSLSTSNKIILAALIQHTSNMGEPFPFVISSLQQAAACCKLSVLRTAFQAINAENC